MTAEKATNPTADKQLLISWPGQQMSVPLTLPELRLGRSNDNDIVVDYPVVSRRHATLRLVENEYHIVDGQLHNNQHQRSTNGLFFEGQRVNESKLVNGDIIRIPDRQGNFIILMYFDGSTRSDTETERIALTKEITIGRDVRNDLVLNDPTAAPIHVAISPRENGHAIRSLHSSRATYINGRRISQVDLRRGDIIHVGTTQLQYRVDEVVRLGQQGIELKAENLCKFVPQSSSLLKGWLRRLRGQKPALRLILDNVSLGVKPQEFTAIVGESGSGKSTLLRALSGSQRADEGHVSLNHRDLYDHFDDYRQRIGYVPQDDIIHRDLTVAEALQYVAQLRLPPDTPPAEIEAKIDQVLAQVAMSDKQGSLIKRLSGGQRKRVSIAVELIADPGIIFLDEPTSGLDPGLDRTMMFTLKQLARAGKTVILVTHTTINIDECDMVAFLASGGRLVFYGPPKEALTFFKVGTFVAIYDRVALESQTWIERYRQSSYYEQYIEGRLLPECPFCNQPLKRRAATFCHSCGANVSAGRNQRVIQPDKSATFNWLNPLSAFKRLAQWLRQTNLLGLRTLTILRRDQRNLLFLLLQAPVIVLLLSLVIDDRTLFHKCATDIATSGFDSCKFSFDEVGEVQKILFLLACIGTWFGVINSIRQIVTEQPIYRRERLVNLSVSGYVFSKLGVLFGLSVIQAFTVVLMLHGYAPFPSSGITAMPPVMEIGLTMTILIFSSASFGLFLSAIIGMENRVMSVIPLFLIPQILFAGIIFPFDVEAVEGRTQPDRPAVCPTMQPACLVSVATFSRWGVEALGASVNLPQMWDGAAASYGERRDRHLPFPFTHRRDYLYRNWAVLVSFTAVCILATILALRMQDVR